MSEAVVHVCTNCKHPVYKSRRHGVIGGEALSHAVKTALVEHGLDGRVSVEEIPCLGNCKKRCRLSIAAPGRWSWLFGNIAPEDDLSEFIFVIREWLNIENGLIPKNERRKWLMRHTLGRVPPVP